MEVEIYLTDLETGNRMRFPMLPREIEVQTGALFQNYTILGLGDIKLPTGQELRIFSWQGKLPGEAQQNDPYIKEWRSPLEIQSAWSIYRRDKKKLRLLVTETPINHDVYVQNYRAKYSGGYGDYDYDIRFIEARDLVVNLASGFGAGNGTNGNAANGNSASEQNLNRPQPPQSSTYTVVRGDTLWSIAQRKLGAGNRWREIFEINRGVIGNNPDFILPGQILTIPI